jgi:hypothetical protein
MPPASARHLFGGAPDAPLGLGRDLRAGVHLEQARRDRDGVERVPQIMRDDGEDVVSHPDRLARFAVEPGIVHEQRHSLPELDGERQIGLAVAAAGLIGADEGDRPDAAPARLERHQHRRARGERLHHLALLRVQAAALDRFVRDFADEQRDAAADHGAWAVRVVAAERAARDQRVEQRAAYRIAVHTPQPDNLRALAGVGDGIVGDRGHEQHREPLQGGVWV